MRQFDWFTRTSPASNGPPPKTNAKCFAALIPADLPIFKIRLRAVPASWGKQKTQKLTFCLLIPSTCPFHTNDSIDGVRKERHMKKMVHGDEKVAPVSGTTLRTTGFVPADSRQ